MIRVLVVSPHPDDESIGCGGTLRKHVVNGDSVHVIFLTSGEAGGHGRSPEETIHLREREARCAADILGLTAIEFWRQPDKHLQATRPLVERLRRTIESLRPSLLYVTHEHEMHPDHRAAVRIVDRTVSTLNGSPPMVLLYEVWTPLQLIDHIEDISDVMAVKIEAVRAYRTQCAAMRFDEAVRGLNRYRGEMHSWPGGDYAEIFRLR
jgi:LmbE family N-acetylglucosaminyl deacetylase